MKDKLLIGASILVLSGTLVMPKLVEAYRGDPSVQGPKGPNFTEERHQEMIQAFDGNDYQAWKELMQGKGRVTEVINEDNFARFAEAHKLALEGKTEEASQIREELGLGLGNRRGQGNGQGRGRWDN